jgi:hypothetical protein
MPSTSVSTPAMRSAMVVSRSGRCRLRGQGPGAGAPGPGLPDQRWARSGLSSADAFLDPVAQVFVHVAPVVEGPQEHWLGDAVEQVADDVAD